MLENCKTPEERWGGVEGLVERWLAERQELIVLYCSLSGVHAFSPNSIKSIQKLKRFCEILVDYVSAGHFEVYDQLTKEAEAFGDGSEALMQQLYPELTETTQVALDFNDKYDTEEHCKEKMIDLKRDLSVLGELLVNRFEMEDRLIQELHNSHAELVS
jgi:regulator of sigma D